MQLLQAFAMSFENYQKTNIWSLTFFDFLKMLSGRVRLFFLPQKVHSFKIANKLSFVSLLFKKLNTLFILILVLEWNKYEQMQI